MSENKSKFNFTEMPWKNGVTPLNDENLNLFGKNIENTYNRFDALIGFVAYYCSETVPNGWLVCDGSEISVQNYKKLYDVIGVTFGGDATAGTFCLPDLRGEFIRGFDDGRGVDNNRNFGSSQEGMIIATEGANARYYANGDDIGEVYCDMSGKTSTAKQYAQGYASRPRNIALLPCIYTGVYSEEE